MSFFLQKAVDAEAKQAAAAKEQAEAQKSKAAAEAASAPPSKAVSPADAKNGAKGKTDIVRQGGPRKGRDPTEIRLTSEIADLDCSAIPGVECSWPNKKDLLNFEVKLKPVDGLYQGANLKFKVTVPKGYPHTAPTCVCETRCYHPNIDLNGRVCLNILRADWNPCLGISHVLMGLQHLFLEPNPDDPLNTDAADLMCRDPARFKETVRSTLNGGHHGGSAFPKLL
jgi:ubiquitin-conjugating enzyme E2 M